MAHAVKVSATCHIWSNFHLKININKVNFSLSNVEMHIILESVDTDKLDKPTQQDKDDITTQSFMHT